MDGSMPLYIYVPITFLTWRGLQWHGRVHAKLKKSFEHKYTMAWNIYVPITFLTWRGLQWHGHVHAKLKK